MDVLALDHMISNSLYKYSCDPWRCEPIKSHYESVKTKCDQVNYKDEIFVVSFISERHGQGGMDDGSPRTAVITRIKKGGG